MKDERACRRPGVNPDDWFAWPGSPRSNKAKQACMDCPFFWECQEYALEEGIPYGVWGGLDEKQREHIWQGRKGGKPNKFLNDIDEALRPLLQDRRDRENDLSTRTTESRGHSPEASNDKRNEEDVA